MDTETIANTLESAIMDGITKEQSQLNQNSDSSEDVSSSSNEGSNDETGETSAEQSNQNATVTAGENPLEIRLNDETKQLLLAQIELDNIQKELNTNSDDEFYDNLDKYLTPEQQELNYLDIKKYNREVAKVKANWDLERNQKLNYAKQKVAGIEISRSTTENVIKMTQKYPEYNHKDVSNFFLKKLSSEEQIKISEGASAKNLFKHLENVYLLYLEHNQKKVSSKSAPNLPNLSNKRGHSIDDQISFDKTKDDAKYKAAIGFKKL